MNDVGGDLSTRHGLISDLFTIPATSEEWSAYRLTDDQVEFYRRYGYLAGLRMLSDEQVEALRQQFNELIDPAPVARQLFYEFNSNESADPSRILFHALGAWRIASGFHDLLWNPAFTMAASQLLGGPVRFWHDQLFYKPAHHGGRRVASGLFLLDSHPAYGSPQLLDWTGRLHP